MKKFGVVLAALFVLSLGGGSAEAAKIKLGVDGGPHEEIGELVQKLAAEKGLKVELVRFADFILPNAALADGDIDVNSFQHLPYLEAMMKDRGYKMVSIGSTVLMPMGAYSKTLKSVDELKDGMTVAIPNDPSNGGRALLLLQDRGLLKVNPNVTSIRAGICGKERLRFVANIPFFSSLACNSWKLLRKLPSPSGR